MPEPQSFDASKGPVYGRASGTYGYRWDGWSQHWIMPPPPLKPPPLRPGEDGFDLSEARAARPRAGVRATSPRSDARRRL